MTETFMKFILEVLYAVAIVAIPVATKYIIDFLVSKKAQVDADTGSTHFHDTLVNSIEIIHDVVDMVSQTYVDSLKKEGKFDADAQKEALRIAFEAIHTLLSDDAQRLLESVYQDLDEWIRVQIESYILNSK